MNKYRIKNQILKGLIGNVATISEADHLWLRGFTHGKGIGTTVLTYLVKSAFNFQRFPLFEDRHFLKIGTLQKKYILMNLGKIN